MMDKSDKTSKNTRNESPKETANKAKQRNRGKKRKRPPSDSSNEYEETFPENSIEMEKNLHASALKNNLDEICVRKILKKVVTNDHVLALVKLREEEEDSCPEDNGLRPKLTRSKAKELKKVSPKTGGWNLENLELTPIKHIPVKTRPEVKALIAQELPEDEDDEEYEPTNDDVPSDDDQGLESCSDLDSQPRTPATPKSQHASPKVVKDGPFKVPQDVSTPTRRKLNLEEDANIALRTRSKLSLSATSIEHIESTFVPPDELPMPAVDNLWNQFLNECLNPASTSKHEDDDETDPEYNVAADADGHDEDEEALSNSIIKISKKELSDLVTELFNIMPEPTPEENLMADNLAGGVLPEQSQSQISTLWEGKQEPLSDEERRQTLADRITFEKRGYTRLSIGKSETPDTPQQDEQVRAKRTVRGDEGSNTPRVRKAARVVDIAIEERVEGEAGAPPPSLQRHLKKTTSQCVTIQVDNKVCVLPEQITILQQQLRQHIQLAASNYLQLYIHPTHWSMAPTFKEYLETLEKLGKSNSTSVVNVCNLKPALELVDTWEKTVSANTPENKAMVEFILHQSERCSKRFTNKSLYVGEFHDTFKDIVANSSVFLYPYLLPPMPYRSDHVKRYAYTRSEDELIALGLDQFWDYVDNNPSIFKLPASENPRQRRGLAFTTQLVVKHMFPWVPYRMLLAHIQFVRKMDSDTDNPIYKFFENRTITPVQHKLLAFNPKMTLYEQPEHEVPRLWVRHLSKSSKRFRNYLLRRTHCTGIAPQGVAINIGERVAEPIKAPLPIDFTKEIVSNRINLLPKTSKPVLTDKFDIQFTNPATSSNTAMSLGTSMYRLVETSTGAYLMPLTNVTTTVNSTIGPISSSAEVTKEIIGNNSPESSTSVEVTSCSNTPVSLGTSMYRLVESSTGAYLMPLTNVTTTVNSTIGPISSSAEVTKEVIGNNSPESSTSGKVTSCSNTPVSLGTSMYRLVESSTGAYLMPLTNVTTTVNSTIGPISSPAEVTKEIIGNNSPESSTSVEVTRCLGNREHCSCCILLRKICKQKQTVITDYFRLNGTSKSCYCKNIKYPKVTKRLRILVSNYKTNYSSALQSLDVKLRNLKGKINMKDRKETEIDNDAFDLDDFAFVTSFHLKLLTRMTVARDTIIKKRVHTIISKFNPDLHDPVDLTKRLYDAFGVELIDMYKEFLCFLTPEQADISEVFRDYFMRNCVQDLIKRVETQVPSEKVRLKMLQKLHQLFYKNLMTACEICTDLLLALEGCPELAQHVFSLFPHRKETRPVPKAVSPDTSPRGEEQTQSPQDADPDGTVCNQSHETMDYEADHSSSDHDENNESNSSDDDDENQRRVIKSEITTSDNEIQSQHINHEVSANNMQQDSCDSSNASMTIVFEEDIIKPEATEWKRDEDKLILEILKEHLTPEERKDKTIIEIIEEKSIIDMLADSLAHKSKCEINSRVLYLLQILVLSE